MDPTFIGKYHFEKTYSNGTSTFIQHLHFEHYPALPVENKITLLKWIIAANDFGDCFANTKTIDNRWAVYSAEVNPRVTSSYVALKHVGLNSRIVKCYVYIAISKKEKYEIERTLNAWHPKTSELSKLAVEEREHIRYKAYQLPKKD